MGLSANNELAHRAGSNQISLLAASQFNLTLSFKLNCATGIIQGKFPLEMDYSIIAALLVISRYCKAAAAADGLKALNPQQRLALNHQNLIGI